MAMFKWLIRSTGMSEMGIDAVDVSSHRHESAIDAGAVRVPVIRRSPIMQTITTIGLDIAKASRKNK